MQCTLTRKGCFKACLPRITETRIASLKKSIDFAKKAGIEHYIFSGNEVSLYGKGQLEVARYISKTDHGITLFTKD